MVKVFVESDRVTVVFPKEDEKQKEAIERILNEVYGNNKQVSNTEVEGLVSTNPLSTEPGVDVVDRNRSQKYVRKNNIVNDKRNPYKGLTVYDALKTHGITAFANIMPAGLYSDSKYDIQIVREAYTDFKVYLCEIYNEEYLETVEIATIKDIVSTLQNLVHDSVVSILSMAAFATLDDFLNTATESQLRSAAAKVLKDTIKLLNKK